MADRAKRSKVWAHFTKFNENAAKCSICKTVVACKGGNTSNLMKHLHIKHSINLKQCSVFDCFSKPAAAPTSSDQPPGSDADGICQTVSTSSSQGVSVSSAGRKRQRHTADVDDFFERMQQMQNSWIAAQYQQSQDREERLVTSILESNAKMVSALMDGIRSLQPPSMPSTPPRPPSYARCDSALSAELGFAEQAPAKFKIEGYNMGELINCDGTRVPRRPLKDEEIVVDMENDISAQNANNNESAAVPTTVSHSEAVGIFQKGLDWLKEQPEADPTQIQIVRSLIAMAAKKAL